MFIAINISTVSIPLPKDSSIFERDIYNAINILRLADFPRCTIHSPILNAVSSIAFGWKASPNFTRWESIEAKISLAYWLARKPNSRKRDQRPLTARDSDDQKLNINSYSIFEKFFAQFDGSCKKEKQSLKK